jgi:hypothetical protein
MSISPYRLCGVNYSPYWAATRAQVCATRKRDRADAARRGLPKRDAVPVQIWRHPGRSSCPAGRRRNVPAPGIGLRRVLDTGAQSSPASRARYSRRSAGQTSKVRQPRTADDRPNQEEARNQRREAGAYTRAKGTPRYLGPRRRTPTRPGTARARLPASMTPRRAAS